MIATALLIDNTGLFRCAISQSVCSPWHENALKLEARMSLECTPSLQNVTLIEKCFMKNVFH